MNFGNHLYDEQFQFNNYDAPGTASREQLIKPSGTLVKRSQQRVILKNGDCNVANKKMSKEGIRFLYDLFTSMVEIQWRWTILTFTLVYLVSWLIFALIWWLIVFTHGDLEDDHLPMYQAENNWKPCVLNIHNYTSCFLFSLETQYTSGYGVRLVTEECPEAVFMFLVQYVTGVMIDAFMLGILFAKLTKPKLRTQTILFSKNAIICLRDNALCLMFRVGDISKSHIIGGSIRVLISRPKHTKEGEHLYNYITELDIKSDECDENFFFIWPLTIMHKIDETSPLYKLAPQDLAVDNFEILVVLEGTVESTGQTTQARTSYLPSEILWGHKFQHFLSYNEDKQSYDVDYAKFDITYAVETPMCSAENLKGFNSSEHVKPPEAYQDLPLKKSKTTNDEFSTTVL